MELCLNGFYPINNGQNDFSELTAIHMYTTQEATFENIGELMLVS